MKRRLSAGASAFLWIAAALIILIFFGTASAALEERFGLYADMTPARRYSLTQESRDMLGTLSQDILIYKCYEPGNESAALDALLGNYSKQSPYINVIAIEPGANAAFLNRFDTTGSGIASGSVIVTNTEYSRYRTFTENSFAVKNDSGETVSDRTEQKLSSAIMYVNSGKTVSAKFLSGHRETDLSTLGRFSSRLENLNYDVGVIDLLRSSTQLDPESDILIVVSPKSDISVMEYISIRKFLDDGGSMALMIDNAAYDAETGAIGLYSQQLPNFMRLAEYYGLEIKDNIIVGADTAATNLRSTSLLLEPSKDSEITRGIIRDGMSVVMSETGSIKILDTEGVTAEALLSTYGSCYAKDISTELISLEKAEGDESGSFVTGVIASRDKGTLALFASSSLVSNDEIMISGNSELISGTVSELRSAAMDVSAKLVTSKGSFRISGPRQNIVVLFGQYLLPGAVMAAGLVIFLRRKRL